ncbi:MAG: adenylate/guanylate cyclase domain-containing protein [Bacteroidota bacterium]
MIKLIKKYPKQTDIFILILGFSIGANFFVFFKMVGLDELGIQINARLNDYHWSTPTLTGIMIGLGFSALEYRIFPYLSPKLKAYQLFILRFITFSVSIVLSLISVNLIVDVLFLGHTFNYAIKEISWFLKTALFLNLFLYLMFLGVSLNFIRAIGNRFGHGILINYILGKYREPVEENRIFMFIDLNGSTKIAEKLGHTKYSRFLNKCFSDLSTLLPKYDAEIYQYVGDEAVVTWDLALQEDVTKPAFLFFEYEAILLKNKADYLGKFGIVPTFKAAINAGPVIVTELGTRRKELAYHGDVLNTASRVLELCSKMKKRLLTTSILLDKFKNKKELQVNFISELVLRGKNASTFVYEVALGKSVLENRH